MSAAEFGTLVWRFHPGVLRRGQYAMNLLAQHRPDLYRWVTGSGIDPFYRDDLIASFLAWLSQNWTEQWPEEPPLKSGG